MNLKLLAFPIALLMCLCYAQETFTPTSVTELTSSLVHEGTVSATAGQVYDVEVNLSIPQETAYQIVSVSTQQDSHISTAGDNKVMIITSAEKQNSFSYRVFSEISTSARYVKSLPGEYTIGPEYAKYTRESPHVLFSENISERARKIASYYDNDIDKVAALAMWVNQQMEYDLSLVGGNRTSIDTFGNPTGVCVDYTNLFLAMSRSLGYPSRSVLGYVYSPKYGWQLHSWAEVYVGEWVGVDPTWLEVGYIDATHIPMYFSEDTAFSEHISAYLTNDNAEIVWQGRGALGQTTENIDIITVESSTLPYEVTSLPGELSEGSSAAIVLSVDSPDYRMFTLELAPCTGDPEIALFDQKSFRQFLHPGMNNIAIPFRISSMLDSKYTYTCPVVMSHSFGDDIVELEVVPGAAKPDFTAQLSSINSTVGVVRITSNSGGEVSIIEDHSMQVLTMPPDFVYDYEVDMSGRKEAKVTVYTDSWSEVIMLTSPGMDPRTGEPFSINSFSASGYVPTDGTGLVEMAIEFSSADPFTVKVYEDGEQKLLERSEDRAYTLDYTITPGAEGRHSGKIIIDTGFDQYEQPFSYEVFKPEIQVPKSNEGGEYVFDVSGPVQSYKFYIDGAEVEPHKKTWLESGLHTITVEWVDLAGNERTHTEQLSVGGLGAEGCGSPAVIIGAAAVLVAGAAYLLRRTK